MTNKCLFDTQNNVIYLSLNNLVPEDSEAKNSAPDQLNLLRGTDNQNQLIAPPIHGTVITVYCLLITLYSLLFTLNCFLLCTVSSLMCTLC